MDRKVAGAAIIGIGIGLGLAMIPFAIREKQNREHELVLYEDYLAERAAYKEAFAMWKAADRAQIILSQMYSSAINGVQQELYRLENQPPRVEYVEIKVEVPGEVKTIEVPKPYYDKPRYFASYDELFNWVQAWNVAGYTSKQPGVMFLGDDFDCDDWVIQMVTDAGLDGYLMGYVIDTVKGHLLCAAIVGNEYWFIEPQNKTLTRILNGWTWTVD